MHIGSFSVPDVRLYPALVEATRTIYDKFPSDEADMRTLAQLLGHKSPKSGAFLSKLAALRAYGLIEGRGRVRVMGLSLLNALHCPDCTRLKG